MGQIRGKHSSARSQYLHCAKKVVAALYKLDTEDPAACARMVEYFLKEDRFNCTWRFIKYSDGFFFGAKPAKEI